MHIGTPFQEMRIFGGLTLCAPVPEEFEIPQDESEQAIEEAINESRAEKISGKAVTPFVLSRLEKITSGRTLAANRALLVNNAHVAARIAMSLARIS